ncbi:MAG: hypothetical protein M0R40_11430 [Firmicutes bacterium]|nr:hypothetical protein [Bacillota bacterium]
MDIEMELIRLKDELERMRKWYDDLLLHLDSDNIIEIDFGRTKLKQGKGELRLATEKWVEDNFKVK